MFKSTISIIILFSYSLNSVAIIEKYPEDAKLDMVGLLSKYRYPSEVNFVTTEDGYILKVYRIPYGRKCGPAKGKIPILLGHGLEGCSWDFIAAGPEKALGYMLADNCYDVWMHNNRGTFESKRHKWLNPDSSAFWHFSWHEMGRYDVPAAIDHVLMRTNQSRLHYLGHSQGNTQFFVYASLFPEESAKKIISAHAFGPVTFLGHTRSLLIAPTFIPALQTIESISGPFELLPGISNLIQPLGAVACANQFPAILNICEDVVSALFGFDSDQFNVTIMQIMLSKDPAGSSIKQFLHFGQSQISGHFRQYDYRYNVDTDNMAEYGQLSPPDYAVENITIPMYLYYGDGDYLANTIDAKHLGKVTEKHSTLIRVPFAKFTHSDFMFANDAKRLVYDTALENLRKHS